MQSGPSPGPTPTPIMRRLATCLVLLAAPLWTACAGEATPAASAPAVSFETVDLPTLTKRARPAKGEKVTLVNFWATWCPPCVREMPELVRVHKELSGEGVRVLAVSLDQSNPATGRAPSDAEIQAFCEQRGFDLPVAIYTGDPIELSEWYDLPSGIPFTMIVNTEGKVVERHTGATTFEHFERMVRGAM